MSELVGFQVRGRRLYERLRIDDLDSLVGPDETRWLPLLRLLRAFAVRIEEQGAVVRFTPEQVGSVELDLANKQIQIKGQTRPIAFHQAVSDITMKPDIYVLVEDMEEILEMEFTWDNMLYEYRIQLDRKLSIWQFDWSKPLLLTQAKAVEVDLPEALPPAERSRDGLQMLEFDWRPSYRWRRTDRSSSDSHTVDIGVPRETLWGNAYNGQYRLQISHPGLAWSNDDEGWRWRNDEDYVAQADWFEWVHRRTASEIVLGDSTFGLSDLVYPVFNATGVRVNGLIGWDGTDLGTDRSRLGLRRYFGRPLVFEGTAPMDATVELILNGRTIDVQNVFPEADSPPGVGVYRFEDIELPNGILNEVTLVIKETNGNEIRVEKSIMGTPQLLPKGRAAYLGVLGTKREKDLPGKEMINTGDFYGYITGGRLLYGLTDRFTVGTVFACEDNHYHRYLGDAFFRSARAYPESSGHAGALFSYLPVDKLLLSGDMAGSAGEGDGEYEDLAVRTRAEYLPTGNLSVNLDFLNLEPGYFDGFDPDVADRRGGEVGLAWKWSRQWSLETGAGYVRNNLDDQLAETLQVDYQSIGLATSALPRSNLSAKVHHLDVNTEEDSKILTELGVRASFSRRMSLYGLYLTGDDLDIDEDSRFLSLLRLRHAPRALRSSQYWTLRTSLNPNNALSLVYNESDAEEMVSLVHDLNVDVKNHPLRLRTEFIKELSDEPGDKEYGFRSRGEYLLDRVGYNRLGMAAEYRHGDYSFLLYLNVQNLYTRDRQRLVNANESRIRAAYGAVHGRVFLDYNGNHILDANEPGVPDVKVSLGQSRSSITDKRGYYMLSVPPNASSVRVQLDVDTVPAIYTVTHGAQTARIYRDSLTEVNLSLTPLISITGRLVAVDPNEAPKPVSGAHIHLNDAQSNLLAADSVTAADGSYYLGNVKPGGYVLRVDPNTIPKTHELVETERKIQVVPTRDEFQEIEMDDFVATTRSDPNETPATPPQQPPEGDTPAIDNKPKQP